MSFEKGDIVKLNSNNILFDKLSGNFIINEIRKFWSQKKYHIISTDRESMTWVTEGEIELVSNLRDQKLQKLGIDF